MTLRPAAWLPRVLDDGHTRILRATVIDDSGAVHVVDYPMQLHQLVRLYRDLGAMVDVAIGQALTRLPPDHETGVGDPAL